MFLTIVFFIIAILITFYLPGKFLLRVVHYKQHDTTLVTAWALTLGISIFLLLLYTFSWIGFPLGAIIIACIFSVLELRLLFLGKKNIYLRNIFTFENLLLFIGSLAMASVMWKSGMVIDGNMAFYKFNARDAIFHLSLIGNLMHNFPPTHAGLEGIVLRGYHFFYDFLLAYFASFYQFNKFDLFFRLFPFFIALYYGIAGLSLARFLNFSPITIRIFLFLLYFAQGFISFLEYVFSGTYDTKIIQSVAHSPDPNVIFSLALLFSFFTLLFSSRTRLQFVFIGIFIGVMPNIKIYTAVIIFSALFFVSFTAIIKNKDYKFLLTTIIASVIAAFVYLPLNYGAGQLIFAPFLLYRHFMESSSMFASMQWGLQYQIFEAHNNYVRIALLYGIAMLLFFIPSLGFRLINIVYISKLFQKQFYILPHIFWLIAIAVAFIIPTLFIQSTAVFVIVQFLWFGYVLLLLPTAVSLGKLLKNAPLFVMVLFSCILVLLSFPDTFNTIKIYTRDPYIVNTKMVKIAKYIENNVSLTSGLLVLNRQESSTGFKDMYTMPLFSGLTNHPVYYEPEVLEFKGVEEIVRNRRETIDTIQEITYTTCETSVVGKQQVRDIMAKTKNQYIVSLQKNECLDKLQIFKKIAEEGEIALYKLL